MKIRFPLVILRSFLVTALSISGAMGVCATNIAAAAPPATFEIVGFYGAANNGGTFVRTVKPAPVEVGDRIVVTGTGLYDGNWTVLQMFPYQSPRDSQPLWGYRIEAKWQGPHVGFTVGGGVPDRNVAKLQPMPAAPLLADPTANDATVYDIAKLDQIPVPTFQSRPQYPVGMRRAGIGGEVLVDFIVDKNGDVQNAYPIRSTHREFEGPAVAAVSDWKFKPGRKGGHTVHTHMQVPIVFSTK